MRVADLDRDMRDVIPTGVSLDSSYLFDRMTGVTLGLAEGGPGRRVLDVASGLGADAIRLAAAGATAVGVEPSSRMLALARMLEAEAAAADPAPQRAPVWIQSWSSGLPFADGSFDAALCKGSIDHFDEPARAIAEMARVTRPGGRVVLAIANFESIGIRLARTLDELAEGPLGRAVRPGRRMYDVPTDHFTRYDLGLMRAQAERALVLEEVVGISIGWGFPGWSGLLGRLPERAARWTLHALDAGARRLPAWADVVVLAGCPRRASTVR